MRSTDFRVSDTSNVCSSTVSIKDIKRDGTLKVFPNPAQDRISINLNKSHPEVEVLELFDTRGKKLMHQLVPSDGNFLELDLRNYDPGLYLLRAGTLYTRLIKL